MKGKIISYTGPNRVTVAVGKDEVSVRLALNEAHPKVGADIEFAEKKIVEESKPAKAEKESKPAKAEKPVKVEERGEIITPPDRK